jgi:hypothetical protein
MKKILFVALPALAIALLMGFIVLDSQSEPEKVPEVIQQETTELVEIKPTEETVDYTERYSARVDRVDVVFEQKDYTSYRLTTNELVREGELNTERGFGDDPDATVYILNWRKPVGEHIYYVRLTSEPEKIFVLDSNREIIKGSALTLEK